MKSHLKTTILIVFLTLIAGCQSSCPPSARTDLVSIYYPLELGNDRNSLTERGMLFYLGHRVERFRLKVRFFNPRPLAPSQPGASNPVPPEDQWIQSVDLSFHTNAQHQAIAAPSPGFPPAAADPDGSFFTQEFTGNVVEIRIRTPPDLSTRRNSVVDFQHGQPRFEIVAVERFFRPGSDRNAVPPITLPPAASVNPNYVRIGRLAANTEVIGFSPNLGEAQHYRLTPGTTSHTESLYISPRPLSGSGPPSNAAGIKVHMSHTGFVAADDTSVRWIVPEPGDSGIYSEFQSNPGQTTFVTVVSTVITPYLIRNTPLVERFESIEMEGERLMGAAPNIDVENIRRQGSKESPFNSEIADYVQPNADYDRRIREATVIASAFALDGSDGQMRFQSAHLYRDINWSRDTDVQFSICHGISDPACRANSGFYHIDMFTADLNDPVEAGRTLHHEWGHFYYDLLDEYVDVIGPSGAVTAAVIDPNSLMGTQASTEFCTPANHGSRAGGQEESCWTDIADQFPGVDDEPLVVSRLSYGRYLDVLHKLDSLLTLTIH